MHVFGIEISMKGMMLLKKQLVKDSDSAKFIYSAVRCSTDNLWMKSLNTSSVYLNIHVQKVIEPIRLRAIRTEAVAFCSADV